MTKSNKHHAGASPESPSTVKNNKFEPYGTHPAESRIPRIPRIHRIRCQEPLLGTTLPRAPGASMTWVKTNSLKTLIPSMRGTSADSCAPSSAPHLMMRSSSTPSTSTAICCTKLDCLQACATVCSWVCSAGSIGATGQTILLPYLDMGGSWVGPFLICYKVVWLVFDLVVGTLNLYHVLYSVPLSSKYRCAGAPEPMSSTFKCMRICNGSQQLNKDLVPKLVLHKHRMLARWFSPCLCLQHSH